MSAGLRARLQAHPYYRWFVLLSVGSGMMMAILSSSIVNIALPSITADFKSDLGTMTWVVTVFMITQATLMPVSGRAGDIYGHKKVFIAGLAWFTAMSFFCAVAWHPLSLIIARGLQAVASSALAPMALAFVFDVFPVRERAQALGILGGVMGAAPVLGLTVGGVLVESLGWRWVFLVNLPLCLVIAPVALLVLKESERVYRRGFDIVGAVLLSSGLFAGLLGLNKGSAWGWTDARVIGSFIVLVTQVLLFVFWERRVPRPMLDLGLFKLRSLVSSNIAGFFSSGSMFGTFVLLPFFFQSVLGEDAAATGFELAPLALMFVLMAPIGGRLTTSIGSKLTPLIGLFIAAGGYFLLSRTLTVDATRLTIGVSIAVMGIGLGMTMAPLTSAAVHDVPPDKRGIASSLPNMFRFVGGSFTIAVVSTFLAWRVTGHLLEAGVPPEQVSAALGGAPEKGSAGVVPPVFMEAFAASFRDVFLFALLFVAASIVAVLFVPHLKGGPRLKHGYSSGVAKN